LEKEPFFFPSGYICDVLVGFREPEVFQNYKDACWGWDSPCCLITMIAANRSSKYWVEKNGRAAGFL
jgi:hypothetical protein